MGSGLIYLIIVGMWIAYFLPRWISTHEEVSGRTVEKFEKTMKVVGLTSGNEAPDYEALAKKKGGKQTPEQIAKEKNSHTGRFLKKELS